MQSRYRSFITRLLLLALVTFSIGLRGNDWNDPIGYSDLVATVKNTRNPAKALCQLIFSVTSEPSLPYTNHDNGWMISRQDQSWAGKQDSVVTFLPDNFYGRIRSEILTSLRDRKFNESVLRQLQGEYSDDELRRFALELVRGYDSYYHFTPQQTSRTRALSLGARFGIQLPETTLRHIVLNDASLTAKWAAFFLMLNNKYEINNVNLKDAFYLLGANDLSYTRDNLKTIPYIPTVAIGNYRAEIRYIYGLESNVRLLIGILQAKIGSRTGKDKGAVEFYRRFVLEKAHELTEENNFSFHDWDPMMQVQTQTSHQENPIRTAYVNRLKYNRRLFIVLAAGLFQVKAAFPYLSQYADGIVEKCNSENRFETVDPIVFASLYNIDPVAGKNKIFEIYETIGLKSILEGLLEMSEDLVYGAGSVRLMYSMLSEDDFEEFIERFFPDDLKDDGDDNDDDPQPPKPDGNFGTKPKPIKSKSLIKKVREFLLQLAP